MNIWEGYLYLLLKTGHKEYILYIISAYCQSA